MADELDPVEQQFRADMAQYISAVEDAVRDARDFADANLEASGAVDDMRDHAAEAGAAIDDYRDHALEAKEADDMLRDSAVEAGEALGHVRDEAETASSALGSLRDKAAETSGSLDLMSLSGASSFSSLGPLVGLIGALVVAIAAVAPAVSAMGLGFGAFGAFAIPTLMKIKAGLSDNKKAFDQLPAPIRNMVDAIKSLKDEWEKMSFAFRPEVFAIINQVLGILRHLLPEIIPLARAGGQAIEGMLRAMSAGLRSQGFITFLRTMTALVVPATQAITRLAGSVLGMLGHALESLAPLSVPFINILTDIINALSGPVTAALHVVIELFVGLMHAITPLLPGLSRLATMLINDIGSSFMEFIPIIQQVVQLLGGAFLSILNQLLPVIENVLTPNNGFMLALRLLPGLVRDVIVPLAKFLSLLLTPTIAQIGVWIMTAVVAFKALVGVVNLAKTAFGLLTAVMELNPFVLILTAIALLVVGFIELWDHCKAFRDFWKDAWKIIEDAALAAWHFLDDDVLHPIMRGVDDLVSWVRSHWQLLATIIATVLLGPVGGLVAFIATHWAEIRSLTSRLISDVVSFFERLPGQVIGILSRLASEAYDWGRNVVMGLLHGIEDAAGALLGEVSSLAGDVSHAFSSVLGILSPSRVFYRHGVDTLQGYINGIKAAAPQVHAALAGVGGQVGAAGITGGSVAAGGRVNVSVPLQVALGAGTGGLNSPQFLHYIQGVVQEAVLRYTGTNSGNGLFLPGRLS